MDWSLCSRSHALTIIATWKSGKKLALFRSIFAPRPWAGPGLKIIAAFVVLVIRAPVNFLAQLLQKRDVLRAVDVGLFYLDEHPAFRAAPTCRLGRCDYLWRHVQPCEERLIVDHTGLPVDMQTHRA